jgi:DNA (cytosine-5)-methyltransferase 1
MKPRLLDLFCGAGGAGKGYADAGFEVVGVDVKPQPRYPFVAFEADAPDFLRGLVAGALVLGFYLRDFAAIHASPPCPRYSAGSTNWNGRPGDHPDLVGPMRELLDATGLPYVMENVPGAPMRNHVQLCGSSFGLRVRRHRFFEVNWPLLVPPCNHWWQASNTNRLRSGYVPPENAIVPVYGGGQAGFTVEMCREAMGIDWMTTDELNDAIPPAFTEHIGGALLDALRAKEAA